MYLPKIYEKFKKDYPEIFEQFTQLGVECRKAGPLDEKCQNLVKLGISLGINSRGGVMSSTRKALTSGASREEIIHAVLLGMTTSGFPNTIAALGWVEEVLSQS